MRQSDVLSRLPAAVEIAQEGLRGLELVRDLRGRFPELDDARARALAERAEAEIDQDKVFVPWSLGRPADGTRAGAAWVDLLKLVDRSGLGLVTGCLAGVATSRCPLCGCGLRITDCDPDVHLLCKGGCSAEDVLFVLGRKSGRRAA